MSPGSNLILAKKWPVHGLIGLALILIFWYINWFFTGVRTHWAFFPLWLGYILTVDAMCVRRGRTSLVTGATILFITLFLISIPGWWLFEWINERAQYWLYLPADHFTREEHFIWSSVCFSTVVPAVVVTVRLIADLPWFRRHHIKWQYGAMKWQQVAFFIAGWIMLAVVLVFPRFGAAFLWMSIFFILDPINLWIKRPSILGLTGNGDWRLVVAIFTGTLVCGFFWECWNLHSWPKWIYTVPFVDFWKIFEMPLLGYLGYLPFGLEIYAICALILGRLNFASTLGTGK